jgi:hypothetical protein
MIKDINNSYQLIKSIASRQPDPILDRLVITIEEMSAISDSTYTAETKMRVQGDRVDFDFTDVWGDRSYCIVVDDKENQK